MTDLKAANQMLAQAIAALESPQHDADVSEAEAIRNRLLDLDVAIGARIEAKLNAHRLIVDSWEHVRRVAPRRLEEADEPIVMINDPLEVFDAEPVPTADAWEAHREELVSEYSLTGEEVPDAVLSTSVAEMPQVEQGNGQ